MKYCMSLLSNSYDSLWSELYISFYIVIDILDEFFGFRMQKIIISALEHKIVFPLIFSGRSFYFLPFVPEFIVINELNLIDYIYIR